MENHKMTQPWTGNSHIEQSGLPIAPNTPYWLMHHEETCWEFVQHDDEWKFLPSFRRLFELPGCNGVKMLPRGGGADSMMARVSMMENGFQILDMELGYQQRYKTKSGGYYYIDIWSTPKVIGKRVIWKFDKQEYNDWRAELLKDGVISLPDTDILGIIIDSKENRVQRNVMRTHIPVIKENYDKDLTILNLMREYQRKGAPIPVPVVPKKRVKKSV
jgi:hypothetical protein